jgi:hypothetical protein
VSQDALQTVFTSPDQARAAISGQIAPYCKAQWQNGIERLRVTVEPEEDAKTVQQGRFYWGIILMQISEQARIDGQRYTWIVRKLDEVAALNITLQRLAA